MRSAVQRLEHRTATGRAFRRAYEAALATLAGRRGLTRVLNGHERVRVDPGQRHRFPAAYEPDVCALLRRSVAKGSIALDVGANVGFYALCLAEWVGASGHVYAFEPNPAARSVLDHHLRLNELTGRVTSVGVAVAEAPGRTRFHASGSDGMSRLQAPNPLVTGSLEIEVSVTSIDAYCAQHALAPDWILIDIEGFEAAALLGARTVATQRGHAVRIVVEFHPSIWESSGWPRSRMARILDDLGLVPRPLQGQRDPLGEYGHVLLEPR